MSEFNCSLSYALSASLPHQLIWSLHLYFGHSSLSFLSFQHHFPLLPPIMTLVPQSFIESLQRMRFPFLLHHPLPLTFLHVQSFVQNEAPWSHSLSFLGMTDAGRLGGSHIVAIILQHTMGAELTEPQSGNVMEKSRFWPQETNRRWHV